MWGAILNALPGVGQIVSGIQGRSAVSNAEEEQVLGYRKAAGEVQTGVNRANDLLSTAVQNASTDVIGAGNDAAAGVNNASLAAIARGDAAALEAIRRGDAAVGEANAHLSPYMQAGQTAVTNLSNLANEKFQFDPNQDPGAQFRMDQALKAIQRSAAARGGMFAGGTQKALVNQASNMAAQEFQAAFNRFQTNRTNSAGMYNSLVGVGANASNQAGQNTIDNAQFGGKVGVDAAQYGGDMGFEGERTAGTFRANAANTAGGWTMDGAIQRGRNTLTGAQYTADTEMGIADSRAGAHLGRANAWNQVIGGTVNAGASLADLSRRKKASEIAL